MPEADQRALPFHRKAGSIAAATGSAANAESANDLKEIAAEGLTSAEARQRLQLHGENRLPDRLRATWPKILLRQFTNALVVVLLVAVALSAAMGHVADAIVIVAIILLNGALGFVQEWRAENTLRSLVSLLAHNADVLRDGVWTQIDATMIVVGDIVRVRSGQKIPADIALVRATDFRTDESALTGESVSVAKSQADAGSRESAHIAFMGTSSVAGTATGEVIATGERTEFGRIAQLTAQSEFPPTHLQRQVSRLSRWLGVFALALTVGVATFGWAMGRDLLGMLMVGISLAVAVVPEGLPAVVTLTLAIGARAMAKQKALSRRLQATETLGAASAICTDKTGTLTENQMTVTRIWMMDDEVQVTGTGLEPKGTFMRDGAEALVEPASTLDRVLRAAMLCNNAFLQRHDDAWIAMGEPTEAALVVAGRKAGLLEEIREHVSREIAFSSERKRMSVTVPAKDGQTVYAKGAPETILRRCISFRSEGEALKLSAVDKEAISARYREFAGEGLRVLALAEKQVDAAAYEEEELETGLVFLGLVAMQDPPRKEVPAAIAAARSAGLELVMITGDGPETALSIAHHIGMKATRSVMGSEIDDIDDEELSSIMEEGVVFARTRPEQKLRIVSVLQKSGKIVAMTGDGVNDAPALRLADIGVAMGIRGTDVARDASDIVLLDDNFATIIAAIREGRRQYENIRKFVRYLLSSNAGEVVAIVGAILIGGPLIFLPVQILWMNLVTDGLTALSLGLEPAEGDNMKKPPREHGEALVGKAGLATIFAFGTYTGLVTLYVFQSALSEGVIVAQTLAFTTMIFLEKFSVFAFRSLTRPTLSLGFFSNRWLLAALTLTLGVQVLAVYWAPMQVLLHTTGLAAEHWITIALCVLPVVVVPELFKLIWLDRGQNDTAQPT